jgi:hypothetical protein
VSDPAFWLGFAIATAWLSTAFILGMFTGKIAIASSLVAAHDEYTFGLCGSCYWWDRLEDNYGHCSLFDHTNDIPDHPENPGVKPDSDHIYLIPVQDDGDLVVSTSLCTPSSFGCNQWKHRATYRPDAN